jgi:hypothetical protein
VAAAAEEEEAADAPTMDVADASAANAVVADYTAAYYKWLE